SHHPPGSVMNPFVFAALSSMLAAVGFAAPPADFARRAEAARTQIGVPGMAIAIVEDDRVTFAQGFGVKALGKPDRVDADTIFPTGSPGKGLTAGRLGIFAYARK